LRFTVGDGGAYLFTIDPSGPLLPQPLRSREAGDNQTESFDRDPGWVGVNNRSARTIEPIQIARILASALTAHAGGRSKEKGEMGGFYAGRRGGLYGKAIEPSRSTSRLARRGR
jgi:hypothetical protein